MKNKIYSIVAMYLVLVFIWSFNTITSFGYISGFDKESDAEKRVVEEQIKRSKTYEGDILDNSGNIISSSDTPGEAGFVYSPSYYSLLGSYASGGLRTRYSGELWDADRNDKGKSIKLTTDSDIQEFSYRQLKNLGVTGSVVVMENETGRIIALASSHSEFELDINNPTKESMDKALSIDAYFIPRWNVYLAPGSVYKAVTSVAIIENDLEDTVYKDNGKYIVSENHTIHNYGNARYGEVNLPKGLNHSINTYFSFMGRKLGTETLREVSERFMIGSTIDLDFTTLHSSHGIDGTISNTVSTSFGQGKLSLSPVNIAMIASSIANDGKMMKPYIIDSIDGETYSEDDTLTKVCKKSTARKLKKYLIDTGIHYGIPEEMKIGCKTGTAEIGNNLNRAVFMAFNDKYTVVLTADDTKLFGETLRYNVVEIFKQLENL